MGIRKTAAQAVGALSTTALKNIFRRPAGNFPGKAALYLDPQIIAHLSSKLSRGSICVVGTNGKTTVTNMLADTLEAAGQRVVCNRTGANLDSGVATSLLNASESDWGVFECDELWLAKILPGLKSNYVVLLNLFRDQLDRVGEVDRIQNSIIGALESSPTTVLLYNADDPFCERIARLVSNATIPFGIGEDLQLEESGTSDARMCQFCEGLLEYDYRAYNQLGRFRCPVCDFHRVPLRFAARNCAVDEHLEFDVVAAVGEQAVGGGTLAHISAPYTGVYMIYNLLAVYTVAHLLGVSDEVIKATIQTYNPKNGRLEQLVVHGKQTLLNLAKNPTGFNQNINIVTKDVSPKVVAFFVNDNEGDGRDISWLWDVDFEQLANQSDVVVFAGGTRRNDVQLRLKYAGISAACIDSAPDCMKRIAGLPDSYHVYMIANYTSLPEVREDMERLAVGTGAVEAPLLRVPEAPRPIKPLDASELVPADNPLRIVHLFPDLLNLYGDAGNLSVLRKRCEWRGIPIRVDCVESGETINLSQADLVFVGSGPSREQRLACSQLVAAREQIASYVNDGGVLLAICGGYQMLGVSWVDGNDEVEGVGVFNITTTQANARSGHKSRAGRVTGDVVLNSDIATMPVVGYENHAGVTALGSNVQAFGHLSGKHGQGNNGKDGTDGVRVNNAIGTYLHGPALGKNPQVADWLIAKALEQRTGTSCVLPAIDDSIEQAANAFMCERLGVH